MTTRNKDHGDERTGEHPALPRMLKEPVWKCRVCGYSPMVDKVNKFCLSCGRDWWGNKGTIPPDEDKGNRPGIRPGIRN